ncbi:MAG: 3-oxoacyl-[acyl-carrier-protein] reductase [Spirochaetia bacterium]|nr:3-oxoacyl-[acyl-carrier-protein] reductase [Spirochaetia bacterium]
MANPGYDSRLLAGRSVLVTGGSRGIGRAMVERFLREGARVWYLSRNRAEDHHELALLAAERGGALAHHACDVSNEVSVEAAVEKAIAESGGLDAAVNNAGITRDGLVFRMSLEDWNAVLGANLTSVFLVSRAVARHMIKRRAGSIVNVSSVVGLTGNGGQTNYAASKAGVVGFSKSLAREVAGRGVRVNVLAPGYIDTAMTEAIPEQAKEALKSRIPLGRTGSPEDVAAAALFLVSDLSAYVTGEVLKVDGGMAM